MDITVRILRMEELRRLVEATPAANIDLDEVQVRAKGGSHIGTGEADIFGICGSICCTAGLAWLHPPFIEQGIRDIDVLGRVAAAEAFFDAPHSIFLPRMDDELDVDIAVDIDDKTVALRRIEAHLADLREEAAGYTD